MPVFSTKIRIYDYRSLAIYLLYVVALCTHGIVMAQKPLRIFDKIGATERDRPFYASIVVDVEADHRGRIWYATLGSGMYRYDGYEYIQYQYDPQDSTSLDSDRVLNIKEDDKGDIWAITAEGINRLTTKNGRFTRYGKPEGEYNVKALYCIDQSRLLVGAVNGFYELNPHTRQFTRGWKPRAGSDISTGTFGIESFYRDRTGQLWACSTKGLFRLAPDEKTFELIRLKMTDSTAQLSAKICMQDKRGAMWIAADNGILRFSPLTRRCEYAALPDSMQAYNYTGIEESPDGSLWLSSNLGVINWHPVTGYIAHYHSPGKLLDIYPGNVLAMCQDKLGYLWLTTRLGLRKTSMNAPNYQLYQIKTGRDEPVNHPYWIVEDRKGGILIFTGFEIYYSPQLGQEAVRVNIPANRFPLPFASHVSRTPEGDVCMSWRDGGLGLWNPAQQQLSDIWPDTVFGGSPIENQCYDKDNSNIVWISTAKGLWRVDRTTLEKRLCVARKQLQNQYIHEIVENGKGALWCNTAYGIGYFDKQTEQFTWLNRQNAQSGTIIEGEILDIVCDNDGALWVGFLGGLAKITRKSADIFTWTILTTRNGLPTNIVNGLARDPEGYIWIVFNNAYNLRIHPRTLSRDLYDVMNPLLTRRHIRKSVYQSISGLLYDATQEGIVVFDPLRIKRDSTPPELVLNRVYVNNQLLSELPEHFGTLLLKPGENAIALEFSAVHMQSPYSNQYEYKLVGYNTEWVACPAALRRASFTNLSPGKYRFLLRAANADGIWSEEKTLLSFVINPPYWQTSWFRALIVLLIAAVIYAVAYNRLQQRRLREEKRLAEQQAKYKSLFLANMSHEIRTPMNAILGLSKLLEEMPLADQQKLYVDAIRHSSEDLLRIVNDILDYSKIESGQYAFHASPFELKDVLNHLQQTFGIKALEKNIRLNIEIKPATPQILVGDPVRLKQILGNLVGNAIKFTDSGEVAVKAEMLEQAETRVLMQFTVIDTGIGISADKIDKVFESFNQVSIEDATAKGGTGLGLSICKQLVEQQGGRIDLHSTPGKGTTVVVNMPFGLTRGIVDSAAVTVSPDLSYLNHCRILLVEDVFFNQLLATELLKAKIPNVHIDVAENGQIALEKSAQSAFDLILMDVKMPVMDGLEATRRLRALPVNNPLRQIPIIGLTANAVPEELDKCRLAGMNTWVTKPIQVEALMAAIHHLLVNKYKPDEN